MPKHYVHACRADRRNDARENHQVWVPLNADATLSDPLKTKVRRYEGVPAIRVSRNGRMKDKVYSKHLINLNTSRIRRTRREKDSNSI